MELETDGQQAAPVEAAPVIEQAEAAQVETPQADATPADDGISETANPDDGSEARKPAKGVQKRLDELTRLRHETARDRDYWRDVATRLMGGEQQPQPASPQAAPQGKPQLESFDTYEDYVEALSDWKVEQKLSQKDAQQQAQTRQQTVIEKMQSATAKLPDFADVVADIPLTPAVEAVLVEADNAAEVLYALGSNPEALANFARLSPAMQAVELGKIAARLDAPKPSATRSPPPSPPQTVAGIAAVSAKDPSTMSMAEYMEWRKTL